MIRLLRSTAFRVALVFALALTLTLTTNLVFALVAWRFYESDLAHVKAVLRDEVAKAVPEPLERLRRRLDLRLTEDLRHLDYVGLFAADGSRLFGNVAPGFAPPEDSRSHVMEAPPPRPDEGGAAAPRSSSPGAGPTACCSCSAAASPWSTSWRRRCSAPSPPRWCRWCCSRSPSARWSAGAPSAASPGSRAPSTASWPVSSTRACLPAARATTSTRLWRL